jgi:phosphoribosylformimino-5-aminoimidazole carboxamide ribotide isomerase
LIAYAAIDLRGGRVVQLVGGRVEREALSLPDPVAIARQWETAGFAALHVVDLDAALGSGSNRQHVEAIIRAVRVPVQVGGGLRDDESVAELLDAGAARVIVGTRAIEDADWRRRMAEKHRERIVVAADVRDGVVVTRGWQQATSHESDALVAALDNEPLAAVLVTDVSREGQMLGANAELFEQLVHATSLPLIAAGGIRDIADLRRLAGCGVAGAVLGMSLYRGAIDPADIATEFAA